jgi:phospholipase/carboxylesterase
MLTTRHFEHRYFPAVQKQEREKLLIVLHGLGDSLEGYSFLPQELRVPEFSYLLLNAPDEYYDGYSWFDFGGDIGVGVVRSRKLLLQLLLELKEQGVRPGDTFLFGFSQGCLMVTDVGLRSPELLGGICGVSGYVAFAEEYPEKFSAVARSQHFLITHGKEDPVVPYGPAERQFIKLKREGLDMEFRAYHKPHTILPGELRDISEWFKARLKPENSSV